MKDCTYCKWAKWERTAAGKLHPSGEGMCGHEIIVRPLPAAFYWLHKPIPLGGYINRKRELKTHCTYYDKSTP